MFGYTTEEAIGQSVATLLIPQDRLDASHIESPRSCWAGFGGRL
jgi:hypothetical protein